LRQIEIIFEQIERIFGQIQNIENKTNSKFPQKTKSTKYPKHKTSKTISNPVPKMLLHVFRLKGTQLLFNLIHFTQKIKAE